MRISSPMCVAALLCTGVVTGACSNSVPPDVTLPASATPVSLSADPDPLAPEFLPWSGCSTHPPFGLRFVVSVGGPPHVAFRQMRFGFHDRSGMHARPLVAMNTGGQSIPNVGPIPFPSPSSSGSSITFPSATPLMTVISSVGSSRTLPVSMSFPCGVPASGTLIIIGDYDDHGRSGSSEVRVRVGI